MRPANLRKAKHRVLKAHKYFLKILICRGTVVVNQLKCLVIVRTLSVNAVAE